MGGLLPNWGAHLLAASAPSTLPIPLERTASILNMRVLGFTALVAIFAGILSSSSPALRSSRANPIDIIKGRLIQLTFIGTHGDEDGLGPTVQNGVDWSESWSVLKKAVRPVQLPLALCRPFGIRSKARSPVQGNAPVDYSVFKRIMIQAATGALASMIWASRSC